MECNSLEQNISFNIPDNIRKLLEEKAQDQNTSLQKTVVTVEEIYSTVKQTADNSQKASLISKLAVKNANEGMKLSDDTRIAMEGILTSSNKISDIVNLVNDIAFQTNILAINAAIESAKAGDQGKGFAVVAIEVRDLSQRSSEAVQEIKLLIEDSLNKVDTGVKIVEENAIKLKEITTSVQRMADIMEEISAATKEQHNSIENINNVISNLDEGTKQYASLVNNLSRYKDELSNEIRKIDLSLSSNFAVNIEIENVMISKEVKEA
ncbi:MAG: hypothetical protein HQK51_11665 [Oligoflexia bacterium]|nr:hypothetical protein [Oligoflexia bacterium]